MPGPTDLSWTAMIGFGVVAMTLLSDCLFSGWGWKLHAIQTRHRASDLILMGRNLRRSGRMRFEKGRPRRLICLLLGVSTGLLSAACSGGDLRGTYQVEISIERTRAPIDAILVLSSTLLPVEELPYEARGGIGEGASEGGDHKEDQADPNSCLILPSGDPTNPVPRSVTFFETRIRAGEARVPFTIFDSSEQRMEIVKLQLFANALGGEIKLSADGEERGGRLVGDRLEGPTGARCIEAMQLFLAQRMALEPSG